MSRIRKSNSGLSGFREPVRDWFRKSFKSPTRAQELGWPAIQSGGHTLILAPTGSGKTLAAFLSVIDRLMFAPVPPKTERCRVLYISPLKALAVDVEKNLRKPLSGISRASDRMAIAWHDPTVAIRTGDTPGRDRAAFVRNPTDILITTPESLYLLLTSNARDALRSIQWVIIDEIHAMVSTKRGAHLALSLERLEELAPGFQRIGLSATQRPLDEVARFLGGYKHSEREGGSEPRTVQIIDAGVSKTLDLRVEIPLEDMAILGAAAVIPQASEAAGIHGKSIWASIHPLILDLIRSHRSTLIFVNSRRLAERMAAALNDLAGEELVHAHHGSIAREQRLLIENELKSGKLPAMVATSSLELGIDMGAIDLVIQVEAPPSVASGLQRIGRAGHQVGAPSKGIILPKYRGDLLACAALTERMLAGAVEEMRYLRNPLDILAQQIVAMVSMDDWSVDQIREVIRRTAPFNDLPDDMLTGVLDMLSGKYPSDEFAELRPRITWDRNNDVLHSREGGRRVAVVSGGTIPDRGLYGVFLLGAERGKGRVGELDEEMVFETKVGDTFVLGASTWRVEEITHDRVIVTPAPGRSGRTPFWHGENAGRPLEFGRAIGKLTRELMSLPADKAVALLRDRHCLNETAARNLLGYLNDQRDAAGSVPDDRTIVIESCKDEMGEWRVCILTPFGSRVHAPWAMAIAQQVWQTQRHEPDVMWTDNGIIVRFPETDEPPDVETLLPEPEEVEDLVIRQLGVGGGGARSMHMGAPVNSLFASRFREAAARALLLPRWNPGKRAPLWQQRKRAVDLLNATSNYGSFPIILETFRECLKDVFDMPALVELLTEIRNKQIRVAPVVTRVPSPFSAALLFFYVSNFMYEGDAPIAERRAQALLVDTAQLRQLLGEIELRDLIDPDALEELERYLQHLTPERKVRHADGLHDLLIRLGDLSEAEIGERTAEPDCAGQWIDDLLIAVRIVALQIGGEQRYIAVEDAGRYRDAIGSAVPTHVPAAFLERALDPLGDIAARYARTHGPFQADDPSHRLGIGIAPIETALLQLEASGRVVEGEFRPGGHNKEWCDSGVLRALRQKSLARLRHETEPVDQRALGRFYLAWHRIKTSSSDRSVRHQTGKISASNYGASRDSLLQVVDQLQGAELPASDLETGILPARLPDYDPRLLDELMIGGDVLWVGCGSIGEHNGKIRLCTADNAAFLTGKPLSSLDCETGSISIESKILSHLATRGASFFPQILQGCGGFQSEVVEALWRLVWDGLVTNDTLQPLRAYLQPQRMSPSHQKALLQRRRHSYFVPRRNPALTEYSNSRPEASGRWSLVSSYVTATPSATEWLSACASQLLNLHGVLTREAVQAAGIDGGFSPIYGVLRAMEVAGRVRRGYFVAGLGATQFALPGALDRLRLLREPGEPMETARISAADPANPYGLAIPWPERDEGRKPGRISGACVILVDGALAAWCGKGCQHILTFLEHFTGRDFEATANELARSLSVSSKAGKRESILIETVDGRPPQDSKLASALLGAGFVSMSRGFLKRP